MIAILQQDHTITEDDTFDVAGKARQTDGAGVRQRVQLLGLARRQRAAARELLLNAGRQALKVVAGEASTQDFAVTVAEAVSIIMRTASVVMVVIIIVLAIIVMMGAPAVGMVVMITTIVVISGIVISCRCTGANERQYGF